MLCDECKKNEATCAVTMLAGDRTITRHLCRNCMENMQKEAPRDQIARLLHEALKAALMNQPGQRMNVSNIGRREKSAQQEETNDSLTCPKCGMTLGKVREKKQLGCSECAAFFREHLGEIIEKLPQNKAASALSHPMKHTGSMPEDESLGIHSTYRLKEMTIMLEKAVAEENYEKAATLRDAIKAEKQRAVL